MLTRTISSMPYSLGETHDLVVLLPGRAVGLVAAVLEIALAVDFDVLPGELLAQPVEAGLGCQLHRLLALGGLDLLVEEDVDAERVDVGVADGGIGRQVERRPRRRRRPDR